MKTRDLLGLIGRIVVGAVLVYAGASKASAPAEEFALVIDAYGLVPPSVALPMAGLLPWLEVFVGWALILGVGVRAAAGCALAMTAAFLFAIGSTIARGIQLPNCGCFGEGLHFAPSHAFAFDTLLAVLSWFAFTAKSSPLSLDSWSERGL